MAVYIPRIAAEVSFTWAHISEFQLRRSTVCIQAKYICTSVEPPHWRALSIIRRRGLAARRSSSSSAATRR